MKRIVLLSVALFAFVAGNAQLRNAKTETIKISGNCAMCENIIEKAGSIKKVATVDWDKDTKEASITYNATKTSSDEILKRIALAGYDNEKFLAPESAYNALSGCCKYEREYKGVAVASNASDHSGHAQTKSAAGCCAKDAKNTMSCGEQGHANAEGNHAEGHDHAGHQMHGMAQQNAPALMPVFDQYFSLKESLVNSDAGKAAQAAGQLAEAINKVNMSELGTEEHEVWMKVKGDLQKDAERMAGNNEIVKQREAFSSLSLNMHTLMSVSEQEDAVYYQHCPMADNGKGAYWLSKESSVRNPYYGTQMMGCGKTVETLK